jgi:hypothetical protein
VTAPVSPVQYAWVRQSVWSQTADQLKATSQRRWRLRMILTVAAAALVLAGSQLKAVSKPTSIALATVAAVVLAAVGFIRSQQDVEQTRRWTRARSVSEAMKGEVYAFLAQPADDQLADRERKLDAEVRRLENEAADLQRYAQGLAARDRPLPAVSDVETYLDVRVRQSQLERYYEPKSETLRTRLRWAKTIEVTLTLAAAALAAVAALSATASAWAAVVTTAVGAVTAYVASERYEFLWIEYSRTASELRRLLDRRTAADGSPLAGMALVNECEQVISVQNEAWMAKWGEKSDSTALQPGAS